MGDGVPSWAEVVAGALTIGLVVGCIWIEFRAAMKPPEAK
jgi:hypothetical protein